MTNTNVPNIKRSLADEGSRLAIYNELLEMWRIGQEIIKESNARFSTPKDVRRLAEIGAAIKYLEAERDLCADYDKAHYKLKYEIDAIPKNRPELEVKQKIQEGKGAGDELGKKD